MSKEELQKEWEISDADERKAKRRKKVIELILDDLNKEIDSKGEEKRY
jgi:hypothetical protein